MIPQGKSMYDMEIKGGMIHFMTGPIKGHPGYALTKTRTVIRTGVLELNKREKRHIKTALKEHPGGVWFTCQCRKKTYHYPSHCGVHIDGYAKPQREETYRCAVCGVHAFAKVIDEAIAKAAEKKEVPE